MFLVLLWLLQDLLTVFTGGRMQIPEIFLLGLVYQLLTDNYEDGAWAIWSAFAGGVLWDLRWIGIPGFFTLGYVAVVLIVIQIWNALPPQGKNFGAWLIVFSLFEFSQILPPMVPVIFLGGTIGWRFFLLQQAYALPALIFCMFMYVKQSKHNSK